MKKARFNEDTPTQRSVPAVVISAHDRWQIFVLLLFCLILCPLCFHSQSSQVAKYKRIVKLVICKVTTLYVALKSPAEIVERNN